MTQQQRQTQRCAQLFVKDRDARKIAKALNMTGRTVCRITQLKAFHAELDALGYKGKRSFRKT